MQKFRSPLLMCSFCDKFILNFMDDVNDLNMLIKL